MNFPMENPFLRFLYWLINTPGIGGLVVLTVGLGLLIIFFFTVRWIALGAKTNELEVYTFPTPTLLEQDDPVSRPKL